MDTTTPNIETPSAPQATQDRSRTYLAITVAAFLGAAWLMVSQYNAFVSDFERYVTLMGPLEAAPPKPVRVTIDFGNGTKRAFLGETEKGMTILSALRASGEAGRFEAATDDRGKLLAIAGIGAAGKGGWGVYLNGTSVDDLPGHVEIGPGDKIEFRYE